LDAHRGHEPGHSSWERWRLAGVLRGEAFSHPLAAGTAALPGWQPSSDGSLIYPSTYYRKRRIHAAAPSGMHRLAESEFGALGRRIK